MYEYNGPIQQYNSSGHLVHPAATECHRTQNRLRRQLREPRVSSQFHRAPITQFECGASAVEALRPNGGRHTGDRSNPVRYLAGGPHPVLLTASLERSPICGGHRPSLVPDQDSRPT